MSIVIFEDLICTLRFDQRLDNDHSHPGGVTCDGTRSEEIKSEKGTSEPRFRASPRAAFASLESMMAIA